MYFAFFIEVQNCVKISLDTSVLVRKIALKSIKQVVILDQNCDVV